MEYFWKQQDDIPAGLGYPLFGTAHLLCIGITLSLVVLCAISFKRADADRQRKILKAIPEIMVIAEIFKDMFLISVHRFGLGYLPLHFCSFGIIVFLLREFVPSERFKDILGEISFVLIMPASLAALLEPDWTVYYPVMNFMNLYSYGWHGALILDPVLIMIRGDINPSIRHIYRPILFLCVVTPFIYLFDKHFSCNYFFINWPIPNSPLSWLASYLGNPGYLLGYAVLVLTAIALIYLLLWVGCKTKTWISG